MKKLRVILASIFAVSAIAIAAPAAHASEQCYPEDPCQHPCYDQINTISQKLFGEDIIICGW